MSMHLQNLLVDIIEYKVINQYQLLLKEEYQTFIYDWNQTSTAYPENKTLHALFMEQAKKTPNNYAVVFNEEYLTYRELDQRSNQLARYIQAQCPSELIILCLERSMEMIIAILGVLKAGCAYVPMVPNYPQERIKSMLNDTQSNLFITQSYLAFDEIFSSQHHRVNLDEKTYLTQSDAPLINKTQSTDLAYVIYTSGTTGIPKGIMVEHGSLVCMAASIRNQLLMMDNQERIAQVSSFGFDVFCLDVAFSWQNGYELHLLPTEITKDVQLLTQYIDHYQITYIDIPTALYQLIDESMQSLLSSLKYLAFGGEKLSVPIRHFQKNYNLIHCYGPTEATVC